MYEANRTELAPRMDVAAEHILMIGSNRLSLLYIKFIRAYSPGLHRVMAVLDDDPAMIGRAIDGVRVIGPTDHLEPVVNEFAECQSPTLQTGGFPMAEISPLRRRMIEGMTVRNLSPATQQSYLSAVSKFSRYFGRSPDRLGLEDVHAFQLHLVATGVSWPALNQIVCALRFFYGVTLGQDTLPERIAYAREPSKLPVVLSADEVVRFLEAIPSLKSTALTTVLIGVGSRRRSARQVSDFTSSGGVPKSSRFTTGSRLSIAAMFSRRR